MRFLDKNIQWIVALNIIFISFYSVFDGCTRILFSNQIVWSALIRPVFFLLVVLYQKKHYGFKVYSNFFLIFVLIYYIYVALYLTVLRLYPLSDLFHVPKTLFNYFSLVIYILGYMLCSDTFIRHFNVLKFLISALIFCILPSIVYLHIYGILYFQFSEFVEDENVISSLAIGYVNSPIIVFCILFFKKQTFDKKILMAVALLLAVYILIMIGKRGPILWTFVNIAMCLYFTHSFSLKKIAIGLMLCFLVYILSDYIISSIGSVAPRTVERIMATIYEGDTNGRLDFNDVQGSTYLMGIKTFEKSPIWGAYFRIIANSSNYYRGMYPHNIFIEMLMTMGIVGFIPFLFLLVKTLRRVVSTFNRSYSDSHLAFLILFQSVFFQLQTTETIVTSIAFWVYFYIVSVMYRYRCVLAK